MKIVRGPFVSLEPHPLACGTGDDLLALAPTLERPLAADLFCGAGGLSLGLTDAGFDVVLAVDNDTEALETHRANHPGLSVNWDMGDEQVVERVAALVRRTGISLLAGGPPCQPFSRAGSSMIRELVRTGRRENHDHRRDLWESFLGVVELSTPAAVVMENVPDMALDRGMVILRTMIERLESLGYSVEERVIDTWRYGVPQFRQRLILVALADNLEFSWPPESGEPVTVNTAIGDLPPVEGGWRPSNGNDLDPVASGWAAYNGPVTDFQRRAREGVASSERDRIFDHITRPVREDDRIAFAQMDHTTRYSDLDPELKRYRDDIFDDKYKRLDPNDLSRTITAHIAKDGYWYIHPDQDRTLTVREAARLQTFPDHVRFAGPPSAAFRQIGNAVPPVLARRIGEAVLDALDRRRAAPVSTAMVAEELHAWFLEQPPMAVPWLAATSRWQVIQAEMLWSRIAEDKLAPAWGAVRELRSPAATLDAMPLLRRLSAAWDREPRSEQLEETARWFLDRDDLLGVEATAAEIARAPHVTNATADLACRVVPGETEDPVLAQFGVLRVAARFQGGVVDRQNRLSDGRLALARMIGGDDRSHEAHLALIEIAGGICTPKAPACGRCPLEPWCVEAKGLPIQSSLPLTSRASPPVQETSNAGVP
ncbi:MAG: DNA (cytosine-5-)-methyltransferase [Actinomycetota bacterium]